MTIHLAWLHLWIKPAVSITQVHCPKGVIKILNYFQSNLMEGEGFPLSHYTCLNLCLIFCFTIKVVNCGAEEPETTHPNFFKMCLLPFSRNYIFWSSVSVHSQHLALWHKAVLMWSWINDLVKLFGLCWARRNLRSHSVLTVKEMKEFRWHVQVHITKYRSPDPLFTLNKPQLRK